MFLYYVLFVTYNSTVTICSRHEVIQQFTFSKVEVGPLRSGIFGLEVLMELLDGEAPICLWLTISGISFNCWRKLGKWSSILCIIVLWSMRNSLADVTFDSNWLYFTWRPKISYCNYFNCFTICCYSAPIFLYILKFVLEPLLLCLELSKPKVIEWTPKFHLPYANSHLG